MILPKSDHHLNLNARTVAIIYGERVDRIILSYVTLTKVCVNNEDISYQQKCKSLGILIDADMRFIDHISKCLKKTYLNFKIIYPHGVMLVKMTKI